MTFLEIVRGMKIMRMDQKIKFFQTTILIAPTTVTKKSWISEELSRERKLIANKTLPLIAIPGE